MHWYRCLPLPFTVTGYHWVSHPLTLVRAAPCFNHGEKATRCGKSPGGVRDYGGNYCRAQGNTGLLDENIRRWSRSTLTLFFPWLFAVLMWTCHSIRAQEDTGLLDKAALSPFGRLHVPSNLCFPWLQSPVWCRAPLIINEGKRKKKERKEKKFGPNYLQHIQDPVHWLPGFHWCNA